VSVEDRGTKEPDIQLSIDVSIQQSAYLNRRAGCSTRRRVALLDWEKIIGWL